MRNTPANNSHFSTCSLPIPQLMSSRPQTLTGLADSPVGLAAFMLDHDAKSLELMANAFEGKPGGLSRDDILDNITLYWLTNTPISSARLIGRK